VAIVALKVVLATISAINDIPLVSSTFELVGLGYTIWFIYRYLLTSKNRQELVAATRSLKAQIFGKEGTDPLTASNTQEAMLNTQDSALSNRSSKLSPSNGKATAIDLELEREFELLISTIRTIRNLRAEADVKPGVKVSVILQSGSSAERQILEAGQSYIQDLAKVATLTITPALETELKMTMAGVVGTVQVLIPLAGVIDVDARRAKLEKDLGKVEAEIKSLSGRLANQNFVSKAAPEVVQGANEALAEAQKQAEILRDRLKRLTDNS
jgi:valyl-tRNA synthetase